MASVLDEKRLCFVGGAPRSGTTWLQLLLYQTGSFATAQETHIFTEYLRCLPETWARHVRNNSVGGGHRPMGLHLLMDHDRFLAICRNVATELLAVIAETSPNASFILEKTPGNVLQVESILGLFPDARFIHIVRDPRAVVASTIAARTWATKWAQSEVSVITRNWQLFARRGREALERWPEQVREVRYEDIIADPEAVLIELCQWLGLGLSVAEAQRVVGRVSVEKLQAVIGRPEAGDSSSLAPWSLAHEPVGFVKWGRADSWRRELTPEVIKTIETLSAEDMRTFGYEPARELQPST